MNNLQVRAERERLRLARGEKRPSRFTGVQRTAIRLLAGFFALMLLFTLLSRGAAGLTVPIVQTGTARAGVLTRRFTASGVLEPRGDLTLELPAGIMIDAVRAEAGQRVRAGDVLLELDRDALDQAITRLRTEIRILDLQIEQASLDSAAAGTDGIAAAQRSLDDALEDLARLRDRRALAERRAAEDLDAAREAEDRARTALLRAERQAGEALLERAENEVKTAEEKVRQAEQALRAAQEAARDAIEGAEDAVVAAQDAQNSYSKGYYEAVAQAGKLKDRLKTARAGLSALMESGASEEEIRLAQAQVDELAAAAEAADWAVPNYSYSADLAVRRAQDNVTRVTERQEAKIAEAEAALAEAEAELSGTKAEREEIRQNPDIAEDSGVLAAQEALESAGRGIEAARRAVEDAALETEAQLFSARRTVDQARIALENAQLQAEIQDLEARQAGENARLQTEIAVLGFRGERNTRRLRLAALESAASDGVLRAPADGVVQSVPSGPGPLPEGQKAAVLTCSDQGFRFRGTLDQKEAAQLGEGDAGVLTFSQSGQRKTLEVTVEELGIPDEKGQVEITALLPEGTYPEGASASLEITRRSGQYPLVLPLSALRSDGSGDYVLVIRDRESVLGIEQTAVRVPVTVDDQDSERMAVTAALTGADQVITGSGKPVAEGDRVRLEEAETE